MICPVGRLNHVLGRNPIKIMVFIERIIISGCRRLYNGFAQVAVSGIGKSKPGRSQEKDLIFLFIFLEFSIRIRQFWLPGSWKGLKLGYYH